MCLNELKLKQLQTYTGIVAKAQGVVGAYGEEVPSWRPGYGGDVVVVKGAGEHLTAVTVPHSILAVLASGDDEV